ncbi:MAG: hypothetical protein IID46_08065 [Planctomycetes bacterium]|nr:hypothetical protein [Planctomycetota bacterium]
MKRVRVLVVGLALLLSAGCGGIDDLGLIEVEGTITMDDKALPNAGVAFLPTEEGVGGTSPSYGTTDKDGKYSLQFSLSREGAYAGKYKVKISTHRQADEDEETEAHRETVPAEYNVNTKLKAEVKEGGGPYDFSLKSKGKIFQPVSDDDC